jgi:hypothetical protein
VPRRWACSPGRRCGCIWSGRSSPAPSLAAFLALNPDDR